MTRTPTRRPRHRPATREFAGQPGSGKREPTRFRLVHHADIISLKGDSYRLKDRDLGRIPGPSRHDHRDQQ